MAPQEIKKPKSPKAGKSPKTGGSKTSKSGGSKSGGPKSKGDKGDKGGSKGEKKKDGSKVRMCKEGRRREYKSVLTHFILRSIARLKEARERQRVSKEAGKSDEEAGQ